MAAGVEAAWGAAVFLARDALPAAAVSLILTVLLTAFVLASAGALVGWLSW